MGFDYGRRRRVSLLRRSNRFTSTRRYSVARCDRISNCVFRRFNASAPAGRLPWDLTPRGNLFARLVARAIPRVSLRHWTAGGCPRAGAALATFLHTAFLCTTMSYYGNRNCYQRFGRTYCNRGGGLSRGARAGIGMCREKGNELTLQVSVSPSSSSSV